TPLLNTGITRPDLSLVIGSNELTAQERGQFVTEADAWETEGAALTLHYRLTFAAPTGQPTTVRVDRRFLPLAAEKAGSVSGFIQKLAVLPLAPGTRLQLQVLAPQAAAGATLSPDGRTLHLGDRFASRLVLHEPAEATFSADRTRVLLTPNAKQ